MTQAEILDTVIRFLALLPALTFHEFAHAYSAYRLGDPTARSAGRVSLNPLRHLDPIGTLMILIPKSPIGWAKPVPVNPYNFREPERDLMISTACGPLANLAEGLIAGAILRVVLIVTPLAMLQNSFLVTFLVWLVLINFALAMFNLLPLGPLDGHSVLPYFLPYNQKVAYHSFNSRYGMPVLIALIALPFFGVPNILGYWLYPAYKLAGLVIGASP